MGLDASGRARGRGRWWYWAMVGFEIVLIISLWQGIRQAREGRRRVEELRQEREQLVQERQVLLKKLEDVQSRQYLEKVAREELNLVRPGETVVIVPYEEQEKLREEEPTRQPKAKVWEWWEKLRRGWE